MHPFILPHLMGGCVKHRTKRSLMLRPPAPSFLSRTFLNARSAFPWTLAITAKRAALGRTQWLFWSGTTLSNDSGFGFDAADKLFFFTLNGGGTARTSNAVYRDPTAKLHIVINYDPTPAPDLLNGWINGVDVAGFTGVVQSDTCVFNSAQIHNIGRDGITTGHEFDGLIEEVHFIDGQLLTPAAFGEVDPRSGAWRPKKYSGGYGPNGFYLPFVGDAGDAPATAAEGCKDRAPIDGTHAVANNWTPNNVVTSDFLKDTGTNFVAGDLRGNFATLNPIDRRVGVGAVTEGNLKIAATTINPHRTRSTIQLPSTGKYIFSAELIAGGSLSMTGLMRADLSTNDATPNLGLRSGEVSYIASSGEVYKENALQGTFATITTVGHHAVWAIDPAGNRAWIGKWDGVNLVWFGGGDPAAGTLPTLASLPAGKLFPCIAPDTGVTLKAWFGAQGFPFAVPASFKPLVVSALPRSTVIKPSQAFVQAVDSGANIVANLTAKRSGWGAAYVEIIKSVAAEGWRIRFGSDAGFYYDSSNAGAGRQAYPALAGASYWGCSLRIGPQYGVAAGSVVHVNGVASVVADGLNTARKAVILFPRAGGNMPVYHPEANAGELLYLNLTNGDAPATDISAVTSSGFSIGAGMASGTYDWLVLAETSGLIALTKNAGTGQADGPFIHTGMTPGMIIDKRIDAADGWYLFDAARNTYNPRDRQLRLETNIAEVPGTTFGDFIANGAKVRTTAVGFNASGGSYVQISIAAAAFANGECAAQGTAN